MSGGKKDMSNNMSEKNRGIPISLTTRILLVALALLIITGSFLHPNFLSVRNMMSIVQQMAEIGIMSLGLTIVIISGGIDLSIGSITGLCATVSGVLMAAGLTLFPAVMISFVVAVLCGMLNALLVAIIKVPAMVATLGTQMFFYGIAMSLSEGNSISQLDKRIYFLGQGTIMGIPFQAVVLVLLTIMVTLLLGAFPIGKRVFAIGNNEKASKYSGVRTIRTRFEVFIICAVLCFVAGIIMVGRTATSRADMGSTFLMECLSAVVLGGTSISGGKGNAVGSICGVLIFTLISNIMNLVGISSFWQQFATGLVLIIVVVFNRVSETRQLSRRARIVERG